jgi:hypothetical protein
MFKDGIHYPVEEVAALTTNMIFFILRTIPSSYNDRSHRRPDRIDKSSPNAEVPVKQVSNASRDGQYGLWDSKTSFASHELYQMKCFCGNIPGWKFQLAPKDNCWVRVGNTMASICRHFLAFSIHMILSLPIVVPFVPAIGVRFWHPIQARNLRHSRSCISADVGGCCWTISFFCLRFKSILRELLSVQEDV